MSRMIPPGRRPLWRALLTATLAVGATAACSDSTGSSEDRADLVTILTGASQGLVGEVLSYALLVRNDGPAAAVAVVPTLTFGVGLTFESASDGGTDVGGTVTWPAQATLAAGATRTVTLALRLSATGAATLAAAATSDTRDPRPGNSDGSGGGSRVEVVGTAPPTTADVRVALGGTLSGANGEEVTAAVTVVNDGPVAAEAVAVELSIPDALVAAVTSAEPATRQNGRIVWALGTLAPSEARQLTVDIVIPVTATTGLTARASSTTPDPAAGNNNGSAANANAAVRAVLVPLRTITGESFGDQFGWVTENLGDLTGDGIAEFASTAPTNSGGGAQAGRGYVYSGTTGAELFRVTGEVDQGQLGFSVDVIGDVNGDGTPDLVFGAPGINTPQAGYVVVVSGRDGSQLHRINGQFPGDAFGYAVGRLGDFDGDDVPDVLIGAPGRDPGGLSNAGAVYIASGASGTLLRTLPGGIAQGLLGTGTRGVGDVNNDGTPDFTAGASSEPGGGAIHLYSGADGADLVPAFSPPTGGSSLGQFWVNTPGDLDGDGTPDIFGVDFNNGAGGSLRGSAYVFSGATGSLIREFRGEGPGDQFGIGRGVGDVTGDGRPDFILAAWRRSEGAVESGKIYLLDGVTGALLRSFVSVTPGETLGFDAIGLGDVTGDGLTDYLVTGGQETNQGKAYVVAGVPLP